MASFAAITGFPFPLTRLPKFFTDNLPARSAGLNQTSGVDFTANRDHLAPTGGSLYEGSMLLASACAFAPVCKDYTQPSDTVKQLFVLSLAQVREQDHLANIRRIGQ